MLIKNLTYFDWNIINLLLTKCSKLLTHTPLPNINITHLSPSDSHKTSNVSYTLLSEITAHFTSATSKLPKTQPPYSVYTIKSRVFHQSCVELCQRLLIGSFQKRGPTLFVHRSSRSLKLRYLSAFRSGCKFHLRASRNNKCIFSSIQVLVHCLAGVSRSVSMVIAYLIR